MGLLDRLFGRKPQEEGKAPVVRHFDLLSDEYKKMEEEVASGHGTESPEFEALCEQLVTVVRESLEWAFANGYPRVTDYPQYQRIRQLGEEIHRVGGFRGMQRACMVLKARCHTHDGCGTSWAAEKAWEGIGGWMA